MNPVRYAPDASRIWYCGECNQELDLSDKAAHLKSDIHVMKIEPEDLDESIPTNIQSLPTRPVRLKQEKRKSSWLLDTSEAPRRPPSILWECTTCMETISIFARDTHLNGKYHTDRVKRQPGLTSGRTSSDAYMLASSASNDVMVVGAQMGLSDGERKMDLLRDKELVKNVTSGRLPEDVKPPPAVLTNQSPPASTSALRSDHQSRKVRKQHCEICDSSFSSRDQHLHSSVKWKCTVCNKQLHLDHKSEHLRLHDNEKGVAVKEEEEEPIEIGSPSVKAETIHSSPPPADFDIGDNFYCVICDRAYLGRQQRLHTSAAWRCDLCNITIHANQSTVHISGEEHSSKLAALSSGAPPTTAQPTVIPPTAPFHAVAPHTVAPAPAPAKRHCTICNVRVTAANQDKHQSPEWNCKFCNQKIHMDTLNKHTAGTKHKKAKREDLAEKKWRKAEDPKREAKKLEREAKKLQRKVDRLEKARVSAAAVLRPSHSPTIPDSAPSNEVPQPSADASKDFYCEGCEKNVKVGVPWFWRHRTPGWECEICDIKMHIVDREEHESGSKHRRNEQNPNGMPNKKRTSRERFHCEVCKQDIVVEKAEKHTSPAWTCIPCGITTHLCWNE